ncbi:hypothetical protein CLAIMM_13847 isoform 3 [Cladophialophora immunda]|nr:hypothetical protein CLAIMM_13847 isoform 3 [Cladophialophora immunda]
MGGHSSTSPVMENSSSRQQFSQRAASPYYQPQVTKTQAQGCRSSTTSQANYGRTTSAASTTQEKARQIANISQHRRGPSMESSHGNAQPQVQMVKSISNLLTLSAEEPPRSQHSAALEPQSMPNYIDPSQVFNPFHKEHERRRREIAAQAEAAMRRKAEEEVAAKRKAEVEAISTAENREQLTRAPAAVTATPNITKANKMANQTKQTKRTTSPVQKPSENEHQPDRQPNSMDGEADMAAGLKVMMEKMQEFRNKDPALFQKLWDDMRNTSSVPSVPLQSPSPQIRTQQALPTTQSRPRPNGYRVVVENNPEGLPDLGRFPAERRIRGTYNNKTSSETETATVKEAKSTGPIPISKQETITTPAEQRTSTPAVPSIKKTVLLSQGFPPPQSTGETMWPEDKRNTLAQVAVRFLKASPENKESEITTEDIHTILEQNPSYTDLCLMLEKKGLKFHRGQFARQLLSDVPQLRGPLKTPLPQAPPAPLASQAPVPAPALEISAASAQSAVMPPGPLPVNTPAPPPHIPASAPTPGAVPVIKFNTGFQAARQSPFRGHPPASLHGQMQRPKPTRNHHQPRRRMSPPALAPVTATATATATATSTVGPPAPKVKTRPPQPPSPTSLSQVSTKLQSPRVSLRSQARETEKVIPKSTPKSVIPQKRRQSLISSNSSPVSDRRQSTRSASTQVPSTVESKTMSTGVFFSSGKRRGRPPGAKNLQPTVTTMKKAAVQELSSIEVTIPSPASPSLPVFKCRWRGCKAHLHNLKTLQNHISKVHRPTAEVLKEDGGYICWWKRCEYLVDDGEGSLRPSEIFDNLKDWLGHIEEHMKEVASKIGDGPTTKIIGKETSAAPKTFDVSRFVFDPPSQPSSTSFTRTISHTDPQTLLRDKVRYLSDEQGRITTPDVSVKSVQDALEPDTMTLLKAERSDAEKQAQKSFMKTHRTEKSSPRAVAEETLKAMAARKAKIGPGIDRGGCILVNEARRATLIQNPGIQRVVDGDY